MVIILTEDSTSGFKFYRVLKNKLFKTPIQVYNTSYGSNDGSAGNSKFLQAIINLEKDGLLKEGDIVFFAVDNLVITKPEMLNEVKALRNKLYSCYNFLDNLNIQHYTSSYVCIEEIFLTFKFLEEFVTPYNRANNAYLNLYKKYKNIFQNGAKTQDYLHIFQKEIQSKKTIEKCLHSLLLNITSENDFNMFKINKSDIGKCWFTDCYVVKTSLTERQLNICKNCYCSNSLENGEIGIERLRSLYRHSEFKNIFKDLHIIEK